MNARLHIQVARNDHSSFIKNVFSSQPFKLADITENKHASKLRLMLMSSSPGVLDGDTYDMHIELAEGSCVQLETQSYQRLFNMKCGATQHWRICMNESSSFIFIPHPCVPHEGSKFKAVNQLYLEKNCFLAWGETITCGRKLNGEIFHFSSYHSTTEIYLSGRMLCKENLLMMPGTKELSALGQLENFTHQASLTIVLPTGDLNKIVGIIHDFLEGQGEVECGISSLNGNAFIVRILGNKAEQLYHLLKSITELVEQLHHQTDHQKITEYAR